MGRFATAGWSECPAGGGGSRRLPAACRPVVIVTRASAVAVRNQVVVAQVTRTRHAVASEVELTRKDGMPSDSVINCDVLLTVPKDRLLRPITTLSATKLTEVARALRFALDI